MYREMGKAHSAVFSFHCVLPEDFHIPINQIACADIVGEGTAQKKGALKPGRWAPTLAPTL